MIRVALSAMLAAVLAGACSKDSSSATQPSTAASGSTTASTTTGPASLPLGTASGAASGCPAGSPAAAQCRRLTVSCPSITPLPATLRLTTPPVGAGTRGTIVLTTGAAGTFLAGSAPPLGRQMVDTFSSLGLVVVEVAWDDPGIWGGPQARTLACRFATAARWIFDNVHSGGNSTFFAAQGTSGGSSQIAFALAHYGLGSIIKTANLGGGPPGCPLCNADGQHAPEPLLPGAPPSLNRDPQLSYSTTAVHFFLGANEPGADIVSDADAFFNAITSGKSFAIVANTAHDIEGTQEGVDAYVNAIKGDLK